MKKQIFYDEQTGKEVYDQWTGKSDSNQLNLWKLFQDVISLSISPISEIDQTLNVENLIEQFHLQSPSTSITNWLSSSQSIQSPSLSNLHGLNDEKLELIHPSDMGDMISTFKIEIKRGEKNEFSNIILIGDAAVSSHYRLGIGINHALGTPLDLINAYVEDKEMDLARLRVGMEESFDWKVTYQLFTILFEVYCSNIIVFEDLLFERNYQDGSYIERIENLDEIWNSSCSSNS